MLRIIPVLILFLSLFCSSCTYIFLKSYGYKSPKHLTPSEIEEYAAAYKIPSENSFELDTAYFYQFLLKQDQKRYGEQVKNHYQPLQALYFDNSGNLHRFYINCYADGFPNLTWNKGGNFEVFPPKTQAPVDSLVNFQLLMRYLKPLPATTQAPSELPDHTIVVFWSQMFGRQSKRLLETVQQNSSKAGNSKIKLIYVNNDNLLARQWQ